MNQNPPSQKFQISIGFMMLLMVVFAVSSACLFYASRVPMIRDELSVLFYGKASGGEDVGRAAHKMFIMFTFTSPLLLAGAISTAMSVIRWFERRR